MPSGCSTCHPAPSLRPGKVVRLTLGSCIHIGDLEELLTRMFRSAHYGHVAIWNVCQWIEGFFFFFRCLLLSFSISLHNSTFLMKINENLKQIPWNPSGCGPGLNLASSLTIYINHSLLFFAYHKTQFALRMSHSLTTFMLFTESLNAQNALPAFSLL